MDKPVFELMLEDSICRALIHAVTYVIGSGVSGDLAEFGTWTGQTACILARTLNEMDKHWPLQDPNHGIPARHLHLFDSFVGLPEPTHKTDLAAPHVAAQVWQKGKLVGLDAEELSAAVDQFLPSERSVIYEGFFCDTLSAIPADTRFALVHVDCDYYESTFQVLDHLIGHHLLSPGAMLLFDDWNCNHADPLLGERKAWTDILDKYTIHYSDEGSYAVFGHKFIVHTTQSTGSSALVV